MKGVVALLSLTELLSFLTAWPRCISFLHSVSDIALRCLIWLCLDLYRTDAISLSSS